MVVTKNYILKGDTAALVSHLRHDPADSHGKSILVFVYHAELGHMEIILMAARILWEHSEPCSACGSSYTEIPLFA